MISLVMIVKNEELILERCVESVRSIADEIIIVDTGSTDGTQDIVRKYGDIREVPFTNFVDTKNHALEFATGDYVLWMDADEYVISGLERLREYAEAGVGVVNALIVEGTDEKTTNTYYRPRLWKNDGTWHFEGPGVHEVPCGQGEAVYDSQVKVRHDHSHREPGSYPDRARWYITLLEKHLEGHPGDTRATFYMARTYKDLAEHLTAITWYERYLELNSNFLDERWQAAYDIGLCWKALGEYQQVAIACQRAIEIDGRRAEAFNLMGLCSYVMQDWQGAIDPFSKSMELPAPEDVRLFQDPRAHFEIPADNLLICLSRLKRYDDALRMGEDLVNHLRYPDQRIINNVSWLRGPNQLTWFFTLGYTPEPVWGDMIDEIGVGGVETTYLELPRALAQMGFNVFVFCRCQEEHASDGVYFIPYERLGDYASRLNPNVVVTSRWFDALYMPGLESSIKVVWLQDAHFADPNRPDVWNRVDFVVCSSPWHRDYIAERYGHGIEASKLHVIPLAIRKDMFAFEVERDPLKAIYSSNPDRGLFILRDMWDDISARVPGIHLAVTYGWQGLATWSDDDAWQQRMMADKERMERWVQDAGNVKFTGRLKKADLYREMKSAAVCLYPNNFQETSCLTALETQAAGTPMITSHLGALPTTLNQESNILITGDPNSHEYQCRFKDAAISLLQDRGRLRELSGKCLKYIENVPCDWADVADTWRHLVWQKV